MSSTSHKYLALLRGINVGGKAKVRMVELRAVMHKAGFADAVTYIQTGNIVFSSDQTDTNVLSSQIRQALSRDLGFAVDVVVIEQARWAEILQNAPDWWGQDLAWKHNLIVLIPPYNVAATMAAIGELKPAIEAAEAGDGVVYQSMSLQQYGQTTTGKLSASPIYKKMTIRNYTTTIRLAKNM